MARLNIIGFLLSLLTYELVALATYQNHNSDCPGDLRALKSDSSMREPWLVSRGESWELWFFPFRFAQDSQWKLFEHHFSKAHQLVKRTNASLFGSHGFVRFLECHVLMLQKMPEGVFAHTASETPRQTLKVPVSITPQLTPKLWYSFCHLHLSLTLLLAASVSFSPLNPFFTLPRKSFHLPHVSSQIFLHGQDWIP